MGFESPSDRSAPTRCDSDVGQDEAEFQTNSTRAKGRGASRRLDPYPIAVSA